MLPGAGQLCCCGRAEAVHALQLAAAAEHPAAPAGKAVEAVSSVQEGLLPASVLLDAGQLRLWVLRSLCQKGHLCADQPGVAAAITVQQLAVACLAAAVLKRLGGDGLQGSRCKSCPRLAPVFTCQHGPRGNDGGTSPGGIRSGLTAGTKP